MELIMKKILLLSMIISSLYTINAAEKNNEVLYDLELNLDGLDELIEKLDTQTLQEQVPHETTHQGQQEVQPQVALNLEGLAIELDVEATQEQVPYQEEAQRQIVEQPQVQRSIRDLLVRGRRAFNIHDNELDLSNLGITSLDGLNAIPRIATVRRLDLSNNQLRYIESGIFANLLLLQYLNLNNNQLVKEDIIKQNGDLFRWSNIEIEIDNEIIFPKAGRFTKAALRKPKLTPLSAEALDDKLLFEALGKEETSIKNTTDEEEDDITEKETK